jgi:hypothetical protein
MRRVSAWLARGILPAAFFGAASVLHAPTPNSLEQALDRVHRQDFSPAFSLAGDRIRGYFRNLREDEFIDEIFGVGGKWKAVTRGRESYEKYVRRSFEKHLFDPAAFQGVLERIREDWAFAAGAAGNRLRVEVYADLQGVHPELSLDRFQAEYDNLAAALAPEVLRDLGMNGVSMAGSEAASVLMVGALTSAGLLGGTAAGAATGVWTFGVGLVVGVAAGLAIDAVVGEASEDAARAEIRRQLNGLRNRIVESVYASVARAVEAQVRIQEACIREMFKGGNHDHVACLR